MKAKDLYNRLEKDFIYRGMTDDWARYMGEVEDFLTPTFKERSMGLVCDFAEEVNVVYTAVFPTEEIMRKIIDDGTTDAMLFVHHPSIWDIRRPIPFYQMDKALLEKFRANRIAIYNLHVPLDNYSEYSTSKTLAEALGIEIEKPFANYSKSLCGVIGRTKCKTVEELNEIFTKAVGHHTKLYLYGDSEIADGRVAVIAGGGNDSKFVAEMIDHGVKVLITGITAKNERSTATHELEKVHGINLLGGTHYSTEKFACQSMCTYFEKLGIPSTFLQGEAIMEDM